MRRHRANGPPRGTGFEAHNRGDLDFLVALYDPDVVFRRCCSAPAVATRRSA
jgi:ketosteroid isomerase-like protein